MGQLLTDASQEPKSEDWSGCLRRDAVELPHSASVWRNRHPHVKLTGIDEQQFLYTTHSEIPALAWRCNNVCSMHERI